MVVDQPFWACVFAGIAYGTRHIWMPSELSLTAYRVVVTELELGTIRFVDQTSKQAAMAPQHYSMSGLLVGFLSPTIFVVSTVLRGGAIMEALLKQVSAARGDDSWLLMEAEDRDPN